MITLQKFLIKNQFKSNKICKNTSFGYLYDNHSITKKYGKWLKVKINTLSIAFSLKLPLEVFVNLILAGDHVISQAFPFQEFRPDRRIWFK